MTEPTMRQRVLDMFGVTEAELAALEEADGWAEASQAAATDRAVFVDWVMSQRDILLKEIVG